VVGNGTSDSVRKDAFVVKLDGSATLQKAGTTDNSVVTYGQLKTYVSENGKSPWDSQSKLLFTTGDYSPERGKVRIYNSLYSDNGPGRIELHDDRYYTIIGNDSYRIHDMAGYDGTSIGVGRISLTCFGSDSEAQGLSITRQDYDDELNIELAASLDIDTEKITHNNKTLTWEDIFFATDFVKNLIDVSVEGM
jgi:hypothetical protein